MNFDAGLFFILLGMAIIFFFIKTPYKEGFMFVSCAIFLILGFVLYADNTIFFFTHTDTTETIENNTSILTTTTLNSTTTYAVIGDDTGFYNNNSKILAVIFMVTGVITGLISFVMFTNTKPNNLN